MSKEETIDKSFKEKLSIKDKSWAGIGKHLGSLVEKVLEERKLTESSLQLESTIIPSSHLQDYCKGISSFGCFFRPISQYCELSLKEIFTTKEATNQDLKNLYNYLESMTYESFIPFLTISPGDHLRQYVARILNQKREEYRDNTRKEVMEEYPDKSIREVNRIINQSIKNNEEDIIKWLGHYKKETLKEATEKYDLCFTGKIPDIQRVQLINSMMIELNDIIPIHPFEEWLESAKFELYHRMQRKGVGLVCGTKLSKKGMAHVNAKELTDNVHYDMNTCLCVYIGLRDALPYLT